MKERSGSGEKFEALRARAERLLKSSDSSEIDTETQDFAKLLHELEVQQIELELQNQELRRTQSELEAARDEFADLYESAPLGYVTLNRNGLIERANAAAHALLGIESELMGKPFSNHLEKADLPAYYAYLNSLASNRRPSPIEVRIPGPDGAAHVRLEATTEHDENAKLRRWRLSLVNITKSKLAERMLRNSQEAMLERTERIAKVGSWEWDIAADTVSWSKGLFRIFERNPGKGAPSWAEHSVLYHPDDMVRLRDAVETALAEGTPYELELRGFRKDGHIRDVLAWGFVEKGPEGDPVRLHGSVQDITERKQVEEALRDSEERFRSIFQHHSAVELLMDPDSGSIVEANEAAARFYGWPAEKLKTMQIREINALSDDEVEKKMPKAKSRERTHFEFQHRLADGSVRDVEIYSSTIEVNGKGLLHAIVHDITEQKERELEYAQILKTAIDGFWVIDMEGRLLEVNTSAAIQLGYTQEEMTRLTIGDIDANETPEETKRHIKRLQEEGSVLFETRHRRKDGTLIDVEVSASFTPSGGGRFVVFTRDITERKRAEREGQLNKTRLEILHKLATMPEATEKDICDSALESMLALTDSAIGFIGFMTDDEAVMQIHAWSSSAMTECAIHDKPIEFPVAKAGLWGEPIRNRGPVIVNDYGRPHPAKKGRPEGHVDISRFMAVPVLRGDRIAAIGAVGNREMPYEEADARQLMLLMDGWWEQVRRKREIREKEALQARLQQAQRLEAIGTLAGGIAHDFNNILSVILGNAEMVMHDLQESSFARESLNEVREASLRARDLVTQILLFAKQQEQKVSNIRLEPIAKECLNMLRASIPTTVQIRRKIEEGLPLVHADPSQIQQVIMNLCTNAGQVMEAEGGTLEVILDSIALESPLETLTGPLPEGRYVRLRVRDTGAGIEPEDMERVFEPFFTTKGVGEGTGLGLAVVHGIVTERNGGISVDSEKGKGTTFRVYLPALEKEHAEELPEEKPALPKGSERILLVDDEPMILKLGQRMLERQGYVVETRASGADALECFKHDPERFDLVVTDMTMPGMRGDRLAQEMMTVRDDIPVILSTGYSKQISEEKAEELGIRAFVMKPLTQQELANTVRRVLDGS